MKASLVRWLKRGAILLVVVVVTLLVGRIALTQRGPPLRVWHTYEPEEMAVEAMEKGDWAAYLAHEAALFDKLGKELQAGLDPEDRIPANRYYDGSPIYPPKFKQDWNRSYVLLPEGAPLGAVVFLHGLTDSPYSLRHIARRYRDEGWVAVAPRLPGHGTVPAGLSSVQWEEWVAATRLAVREARRLAGPSAPIQIVGFSNGGALAMMYALDALGDKNLARPERIILVSPMIGVTSFARFAGVAGLPAMLPRFAKASWLDVMPEFNPFKYNSFPVNGATQSHRLTQVLQSRIARYEREGRLQEIAPIITFQSILDFTVHTRAIIEALYAHLPKNGSELVLFDLNRTALFSPLLRSSMETLVDRMLPEPPRNYRTTIITNGGPGGREEVEKVIEAGQTEATFRPLGLFYPQDVFSLSHVAIPFPPGDALYGLQPDGTEDFGISLGSLAGRGERGALIVSLDALLRVSSNPFFPYVLERVDEGIVPRRNPLPAR